jgi:uncharacterized damage-inducible protein DinB
MTSNLLKMFRMARTRLTNQLPKIKEEDLLKKLHPESASIGFLLRHIGEVEQLFAKNVFGLDIRVTANTLGNVKDSGRFNKLQELLDNISNAAEVLEKAINSQTDADWHTDITTAEFGTVSKAEALSRIISHTAYHSGQIAIILKYA